MLANKAASIGQASLPPQHPEHADSHLLLAESPAGGSALAPEAALVFAFSPLVGTPLSVATP